MKVFLAHSVMFYAGFLDVESCYGCVVVDDT